MSWNEHGAVDAATGYLLTTENYSSSLKDSFLKLQINFLLLERIKNEAETSEKTERCGHTIILNTTYLGI